MPPSTGGKSVVSNAPRLNGRRAASQFFSFGELDGLARMDVMGSLGTLQTGIQPMRKVGAASAGQGEQTANQNENQQRLNKRSDGVIEVALHGHGALGGDQRGDSCAAEWRKMGFPSIHQSQQRSPHQRSQRNVGHSA